MHFSGACSQKGLSAEDIGANTLRARYAETPDMIRIRMLLASSEDRALHLTVLLREADHRIKNSLQIACSIMQAEARRADNDELRDGLRSAASRIQAISMVHDELQVSGGESLMDIDHLMELMCNSMQALCDGKAEMDFHVGAMSLDVPIAFARPLMLLVNEIIVNALRHAFPLDRLGTIAVSIERVADQIRIVVKDDGVGLETTNSGHTGFGTELMDMMTRQIGGKLVSDCTSGTCFTLTAPLPLNPGESPADTPASAIPQPPVPQNDT